jgi:N-methylhydantoinase A/oxoprolinase/acetone carboxylase beta subunit
MRIGIDTGGTFTDFVCLKKGQDEGRTRGSAPAILYFLIATWYKFRKVGQRLKHLEQKIEFREQFILLL